MREQTETEKAAHVAAKAWFRSRGVPNWTAEYQTTYPHFIRGYLREIKRQEKARARAQ